MPPVDLMRGLNPAQRSAVQTSGGPVLVLAGPGSGKTRVLTHRIAHLIGEMGVPPYAILAVTFTNKAAREMVSRLEQLIGPATDQLTVGTFHATCVRLLRREAAYAGLGSNFVIYDADDQRRLVTRILKELNLDTKMYRPSAVLSAISRAKNELITASAYRPPTYWHEAVARVFERYDDIKASNNALDFDDLLLKTELLLREHDEVRERYQRRYQHTLVDEFQDTNKAQYDIVHHLAGENRNVFVVGDEDQSIYSWRGADFRNVRRFQTDFQDAQLFKLEQNYRSTQNILDAAQAIISRNRQRTDKELWTENASGEPIRFFEAYDEREEAEYVVSEIQRSLARGQCELGDFAIMFRTNAQSRALEDAFVRHGLAYKLVGATRFYQRREIKDVLCYLRAVYSPEDDVALTRVINVPRRGIGAKTIEQLNSYARMRGISPGQALLEMAKTESRANASGMTSRSYRLLRDVGALFSDLNQAKQERPLGDLLQLVLDRTGYLQHLRDGTEEGEDRINNVRELFTAVERFGDMPAVSALASFLEETALVADVDETDWSADAVTLLTLHSAKGLEFDTVFIVGMEEGICPHSRSLDDPDSMEEERRLCYVGVTRAKRQLHLVRTFRRTMYGSSDVRDPSRFLAEIPQRVMDGKLGHRALAKRPTPGPTRSRDSRQQLYAERRARVQQARIAASLSSKLKKRTAAAPASRTSSADRPERPPAPALPGFAPGESVVHPIFGPGTVVNSKRAGDDEEVTVAFEGRGVKRLIARYAKLERT